MILAVTLSYHVVLLYVYPIAVASLYFSGGLNIFASIITVVGVTVGQIVSYLCNFVTDHNYENMKIAIMHGALPRYEYTDIAVQKLENDFPSFKKPSSPSLFAVNLDETVIDDKLIQALADKLVHGGKRFTRVAVVGADAVSRRKLKKALCGGGFALKFINDFEKAKEWLVSEDVM